MIGWPPRASSLSPGIGDDALDEVLLGVLGIREDHHVAALGRHARPQALVRPRDRRAVRELVHEDVIADLQRRDHRAARDLERLDDERAERHRDGDRRRGSTRRTRAPRSCASARGARRPRRRPSRGGDEASLVERLALIVASSASMRLRSLSRSLAVSSRSTRACVVLEDAPRPLRAARARSRTGRACPAAGPRERGGWRVGERQVVAEAQSAISKSVKSDDPERDRLLARRSPEPARRRRRPGPA